MAVGVLLWITAWVTEVVGVSAVSESPGSPFPNLASSTHSNFQTYQYLGFSGMVVCWTEEPLLGCRCLTCRFKGRYKGDFSVCQYADVTLILPSWTGTLLPVFILWQPMCYLSKYAIALYFWCTDTIYIILQLAFFFVNIVLEICVGIYPSCSFILTII